MDSNKIKNLAFGARDALRLEVAARIDAVLTPHFLRSASPLYQFFKNLSSDL